MVWLAALIGIAVVVVFWSAIYLAVRGVHRRAHRKR